MTALATGPGAEVLLRGCSEGQASLGVPPLGAREGFLPKTGLEDKKWMGGRH
jgi:hypothetical protein